MGLKLILVPLKLILVALKLFLVPLMLFLVPLIDLLFLVSIKLFLVPLKIQTFEPNGTPCDSGISWLDGFTSSKIFYGLSNN